jgi:hypothetical protein
VNIHLPGLTIQFHQWKNKRLTHDRSVFEGEVVVGECAAAASTATVPNQNIDG